MSLITQEEISNMELYDIHVIDNCDLHSIAFYDSSESLQDVFNDILGNGYVVTWIEHGNHSLRLYVENEEGRREMEEWESAFSEDNIALYGG